MESVRCQARYGMSDTHVSVLQQEAIAALEVVPGKKYIDATTGAGGHSLAIVKKGGVLLGIDQDKEALRIATRRLEQEQLKPENWTFTQGNFRNIETLANAHGFNLVSGILFDLGVSSMQLDTPERGFSYRFTDAPLDLRMDTSTGDTAAQLVNRVTAEELYDIFSSYGEEQLARKLADAVYRARSVKRIVTVGDLVEVVASVVPGESMRYGVLSRIFQGLRIAVNDELSSLKLGLEGAKRLLVPGGVLAVISFHSLEDRIVKQFMRQAGWQVITKHPIRPGEQEQEVNRRSRSAKLRVAKKL